MGLEPMVVVFQFLARTVARTINEFVDGLQTAASRLLILSAITT